MTAGLWRRLFSRHHSGGHPAKPPPGLVTAVPDAMPVYAVGDIHGQIRQLRQSLEWIAARSAEDAAMGLTPTVVFLGDYVDRGEDSRAVLDCLSRLERLVPRAEHVFLAGNHEAALLAFLDAPADHASWLDFGGTETLLSYGLRPPPDHGARRLRQVRDQLADALPEDHLSFLRRLRPSFQAGEYVFVHAGLRPGIPLEHQTTEDMLWIRADFLNHPHWHGKCVVHGHTIVPEPAVQAWRIGIDTGAYAGGPLTCLALRADRQTVVGFP